MGTDEKALIEITKNSNYAMRDAIATAYQKQTGQALVELLRKELSGNLESVMMAMYTPRYDFWAEQINDAIKGAGTNEKKLIDLIICCSDEEMPMLDKAYTAKYKKSIHSAISGDCGSSDWGKLLKDWVQNENDCSGSPEEIAASLFKAAKGVGTDEKEFVRIMTNCSHATYQAVDAAFNKIY